jgi:hypothetical protein
MRDTHSDALVFFGATGDLACKKIFPALMMRPSSRSEDGPTPQETRYRPMSEIDRSAPGVPGVGVTEAT